MRVAFPVLQAAKCRSKASNVGTGDAGFGKNSPEVGRNFGRRQNFSLHLPLAGWEDSRACFTWGPAVGPDTQGCREGELLQVPASRAELTKVSRSQKKSANK